MEGGTAQGRREPPEMVKKLQARQEEFQERGRIYRYSFVAAGFIVLLGGIAMLALPGPAFVVIPIGLAILSLQFAWAGALLEKALDRAEAAKETTTSLSTSQKIVVGCAIAAGVAAFVVCAILYDIPVLPV